MDGADVRTISTTEGMELFNFLRRYTFQIAEKRGKYADATQFAHVIGAMHGEISELLASLTYATEEDSVIEEWADVIIVMFSFAGWMGWEGETLFRAVINKCKYNQERSI